MRITIATGPSFPVPALRGGAIPRIWHGIAKELAQLGASVTIMARSFPGQPKEEIRNGVRYLRWGGFDQSRRVYVDLARTLVNAAMLVPRLPAADVLVANDFWLPVFAPFRAAAGRVVINANRVPKWQFALYARARLIAAASSAVGDAINAQTPWLRNRVTVIPNPVDTLTLSSKRPEAGRASGRILFVGRVHPEKGLDLLIDAFRQLHVTHPHSTLVVIGPHVEGEGGGGAEYLQQLQARATGLPVSFVGPVFDLSTLAEWYGKAQVFCYPSLADGGEAFGVAPLEAMAAGAVPVVSNLACFDEFLEHGSNGFKFDHLSAKPQEALAHALQQALEVTAQGPGFARSGVNAAARFSYRRVAERYMAAFEALIEDPPAGEARP